MLIKGRSKRRLLKLNFKEYKKKREHLCKKEKNHHFAKMDTIITCKGVHECEIIGNSSSDMFSFDDLVGNSINETEEPITDQTFMTSVFIESDANLENDAAARRISQQMLTEESFSDHTLHGNSEVLDQKEDLNTEMKSIGNINSLSDDILSAATRQHKAVIKSEAMDLESMDANKFDASGSTNNTSINGSVLNLLGIST